MLRHGSARLPSTAAYGSRAVANAQYGEFINFDVKMITIRSSQGVLYVSRTGAEVPLAHPVHFALSH